MGTGHGCTIHTVSGAGTAIGAGTVIGDFTPVGAIRIIGEAGTTHFSGIHIGLTGITLIMARIMTTMHITAKVNADA